MLVNVLVNPLGQSIASQPAGMGCVGSSTYYSTLVGPFPFRSIAKFRDDGFLKEALRASAVTVDPVVYVPSFSIRRGYGNILIAFNRRIVKL